MKPEDQVKDFQVLENLANFMYNEINRIDTSMMPFNARKELREALIMSIDLKRKIELSRAWIITDLRDQEKKPKEGQ